MKKKIIDCFKKSAFQWELFRLKQDYDNKVINLFEKNYDTLSLKEKKYLRKKIKKKKKKLVIGDIAKSK